VTVVAVFAVAGGEEGVVVVAVVVVGGGGGGGYDGSATSCWNRCRASANPPNTCPAAKCSENSSWTLPNRWAGNTVLRG